jgi:DNA polymerase II small subunit
MNLKQILNFCIERGVLIDNEALSLFNDIEDFESVKLIISKIKDNTQTKMITKEIIYEHREKVDEFLSDFPKERLEKLKIKLGLSIEISRQESENSPKQIIIGEQSRATNTTPNSNLENSEFRNHQENIVNNLEVEQGKVKILTTPSSVNKKIEVKDFITHFRGRFNDLKNSLQEHSELKGLVSINKIIGNKQGISVLGMVYDKRITKNKNIILDIEDMTGRVKVLINQNKQELYKQAEDITLDSVISVKGSGSRDIIFANKIFSPDSFLFERKKSPVDEAVVFISDVHVGSQNFMEYKFLKFIDYLNCKSSNPSEAEKIKYLFVVGDLVAGLGVYPNQEKELAIKDIEGQYAKVAELFGKIRKDIQIVIIPGNHDCVRLMEPQPILDEKYAWPLYNMKNVTLAANPTLFNIGQKDDFPGFNILAYHGFSYYFYAHNVPSLIEEDAAHSPDKVMAYLLKNKHLAPTHTSVQYYPHEKDNLMIREAPDIFVSGHTHKGAISYYNNTLLISSTCWEELMPYQEKMGFESDYCKVPMFNLKTRQVKMLDFYEDEE